MYVTNETRDKSLKTIDLAPIHYFRKRDKPIYYVKYTTTLILLENTHKIKFCMDLKFKINSPIIPGMQNTQKKHAVLRIVNWA